MYVLQIAGSDPIITTGMSAAQVALEDQYGGRLIGYAKQGQNYSITWMDSADQTFPATLVASPVYTDSGKLPSFFDGAVIYQRKPQ